MDTLDLLIAQQYFTLVIPYVPHSLAEPMLEKMRRVRFRCMASFIGKLLPASTQGAGNSGMSYMQSISLTEICSFITICQSCSKGLWINNFIKLAHEKNPANGRH